MLRNGRGRLGQDNSVLRLHKTHWHVIIERVPAAKAPGMNDKDINEDDEDDKQHDDDRRHGASGYDVLVARRCWRGRRSVCNKTSDV